MRLLSCATIQGCGGTRYAKELAEAEGSVRNGSRREMIVAVAPASFATSGRFTQVLARDRGRRAPEEECSTRILWHAASNLYRGKEIFQAPGDSDITGHLLMGRTCVGFGCSRNLGCPDPRGIVVDMTLAV
jgi:hypothetical protein